MSSALAVRSSVPPVPAATVARPRLEALLDAGRDGAFTLVGAPPGWGKTVLLSGWAIERDAAWLTLGACHADERRLWTDVCEALGQDDIAIDADVPLALADALAGATERPILVLDDLHHLRGPALASLGELLVHGGDALHVVAATRADPELPLARLRLSGRMRELRAADLACTREEASALLQELGLSLRPELVLRLLERTEGWAAGLRLAGLSLRGEADPDAFVAEFAGDDRAIADYLTGEVLAGLPPATRELLLRTSIAGRVAGGLADALTGGSDGALALEELDRTGTFLVPLDRHRTWFRYHGLFAELLRARLRLEHPGLEPELHARAAEWLAGAGLGREAIPHALRAGGLRSAAALVADHWLDLLLDVVAPEAITEVAEGADDARLAVSGASARLALGDPAGAVARLAGVREDDGDAGRLAILLRARVRGDTVLAEAQSAALLRGAGPGHDGDALRALTLFHHGATEFSHGRLEVAAERLEGAAAIAVESERDALLLGCLGRSAALELAEGRLRRADHAARNALALAEPRGWHRTARRHGPMPRWPPSTGTATSSTTPSAAPTRRRLPRTPRGRATPCWRRARCARTSRPSAATSSAPVACCAPCTRGFRTPGRCRSAGSRPSAPRRGRRTAPRGRSTRPPTGSRAATRWPRCAASRGCPSPIPTSTRCCACTRG